MIVGVRFINKGTNTLSNKEYYYKVNKGINLIKEGTYEIEADYSTTYNNPVVITTIFLKMMTGVMDMRTITKAKLLSAPPIKKYHKQIYVNKNKGVVVVKWKDGTETKMKVHPEDTFDVEKGVALCFMKKMHDNRGAYYNIFKDIKYFEDEQNK